MTGRVFLYKDGFVDITRRQLGRLAAVGTGALLLPGLLPAGSGPGSRSPPAPTTASRPSYLLVMSTMFALGGISPR